jgi:hypothetical protein
LFSYAIPIENQLSKQQLVELVSSELGGKTDSLDITDLVFKGFYTNTLKVRGERNGWDYLSLTGIVNFAWILYILSYYGFIGMSIITTRLE